MKPQDKDSLWAAVQKTLPASTPSTPGDFPPPVEDLDLTRLASALASLDPDNEDEKTWAVYRIAPLANAARERPELHDLLYELACRYSSGQLKGEKARTWTQKTKLGAARRGIIGGTWFRFLKSNRTERVTRVGSIYFHALQAGWTPPEVAEDHQERGGQDTRGDGEHRE